MLRRPTVQSAQPRFMMDRATRGMTPTPTRRSLTARLMISTDATEWKALVVATMAMTRELPTERHSGTEVGAGPAQLFFVTW